MRLRIYGSDGVELNIGDTVRVSNSRNRTEFYTTVVLHDGRIYPFYCFSYDRVERVEGVPTDAIPCNNPDGYPAPMWAVHKEDPDERERMHTWMFEAMDMGEQRGRFYRIEP